MLNSTSNISLLCLDVSRILNVYLGPIKNFTGIIFSLLNSFSFYYIMRKKTTHKDLSINICLLDPLMKQYCSS